MPYDRVLHKRIISKLNLSNTHYGKQITIDKDETASYKYFDNTWKSEKETNLAIHAGAGAIGSTPTDMVKFIEALFRIN